MRTRRDFLVNSTAVLVSPYLHASLAQSAPAQNVFTNASLGAYQQGILTKAQFEARMGSLFMIFVDESNVLYTRLRAVTPYTAKAATKLPGRLIFPRPSLPAPPRQIEAFTLVFDSDKPLPEQNSYLVDHATLGRFVIFLVPGFSPTGSPICTSVFSNFVEA